MVGVPAPVCAGAGFCVMASPPKPPPCKGEDQYCQCGGYGCTLCLDGHFAFPSSGHEGSPWAAAVIANATARLMSTGFPSRAFATHASVVPRAVPSVRMMSAAFRHFAASIQAIKSCAVTACLHIIHGCVGPGCYRDRPPDYQWWMMLAINAAATIIWISKAIF